MQAENPFEIYTLVFQLRKIAELAKEQLPGAEKLLVGSYEYNMLTEFLGTDNINIGGFPVVHYPRWAAGYVYIAKDYDIGKLGDSSMAVNWARNLSVVLAESYIMDFMIAKGLARYEHQPKHLIN